MAANISIGIARLYAICDKLLRLTEQHLCDVESAGAHVADSDEQLFNNATPDLIAVLEQTENMLLFMDTWDTFLNPDLST